MYFLTLAADYDGTLAADGRVSEKTVDALKRVRASGRKLVMVTGRHLPDLSAVFPHLDLFDRVVVENGGLLYRPGTHEEKLLSEPPNERFVLLLRERGIPFALGRTVVATWQPHEEAVLKAIRELGLDLQVIFNKGAVMVLPSGVNKGTGLKAALSELGISTHNVVGVGDAENDHAFLRLVECSVAVSNALPAVKERADVVMNLPRGEGVTELCQQLLSGDLAQFDSPLKRHAITLGERLDLDRGPVLASPRGGSILVAGRSGSGKSTAVSGIVEQLAGQGYQFCLIDPEGDYEGLSSALSFGTAKEEPDTKAVEHALDSPKQNVVINMLGVSLDERPGFLVSLLPHIQHLRTRTARPHWLVIDEAHHLLPASWSPAAGTLPEVLERTVLITVHPEHVAKAALNAVEIVIAIGDSAEDVFRSFARQVQIQPPKGPLPQPGPGDALIWFRNSASAPMEVKTVRSSGERMRHRRSYAEGELSPQQSFFFRGPERKLNLRAHNLQTFLQLAEGVDDETWYFHLRNGDYSNWFRKMIKDEELARQTEEIEADATVSLEDSRQRIRQAVESRYTAAV